MSVPTYKTLHHSSIAKTADMNVHSNTQVLKTPKIFTILVIVLNEGYIHLHTFDIPEVESVWKERHPRFPCRSQRHRTGDADWMEWPCCEVGVEEPNHVIAGQKAGGVTATECWLIGYIGVAGGNRQYFGECMRDGTSSFLCVYMRREERALQA